MYSVADKQIDDFIMFHIADFASRCKCVARDVIVMIHPRIKSVAPLTLIYKDIDYRKLTVTFPDTSDPAQPSART